MARENEIDLVADLRSVMADEELCDVTLVGTDDESVPASRFILSARSTVFRTMLTGEFSEASSRTVKAAFSSKVLRMLVSYCCTDKAFATEIDIVDEGLVASIVQLYFAAGYYDLSSLRQNVFWWLTSKISKDPSLACAALSEASNQGHLDSRVGKMALEVIRLETKRSLTPAWNQPGRGLPSLNDHALGLVISDKKMCADEGFMFECLEKWVSGGEDGAEGRKEVASDLVKKMDLSLIPPSQLDNAAESNDFIGPDHLAQTFRLQALKAETAPLDFSVPRSKFSGGISVLVSGAGETDANGTYLAVYSLNGTPVYSRQGTWQGRAVEFVIGKRAVYKDNGASSHTWYISVNPGPNTESNNEDLLDLFDLYCYGPLNELNSLEGIHVSPIGAQWKIMVGQSSKVAHPAPKVAWPRKQNEPAASPFGVAGAPAAATPPVFSMFGNAPAPAPAPVAVPAGGFAFGGRASAPTPRNS